MNPDGRFQAERQAFREFANAFQAWPELQRQMEEALAEIYWTYDTTIWDNRFVVGGAFEHILGAAMRACGLPLLHRAIVGKTADLVSEDGSLSFSVKSILKGNQTNLINTRGEAPTLDRWDTATLFPTSATGIVYADPDLLWWQTHLDGCLTVAKDALSIKKRCVTGFAVEQPQWCITCHIPSEQDRPTRQHPSRSATTDLVSHVLYNYPILHQHFPELEPGQER